MEKVFDTKRIIRYLKAQMGQSSVLWVHTNHGSLYSQVLIFCFGSVGLFPVKLHQF